MDDQAALERWLESDGRIGQCPEWYVRLLLAAQIQLPPWEIDLSNPVHAEWVEHAKAAKLAERRATESRWRRQSRDSARVHSSKSGPMDIYVSGRDMAARVEGRR